MKERRAISALRRLRRDGYLRHKARNAAVLKLARVSCSGLRAALLVLSAARPECARCPRFSAARTSAGSPARGPLFQDKRRTAQRIESVRRTLVLAARSSAVFPALSRRV